MTAVSWQMWANPVIDSGREMNVPLRILRGETIYSQVYYLYGPVAPLFNALLYKIFGVHLNTLYAAGLAGSLLLVFLIFRIARWFMGTYDSLLAAGMVLLLCVFKQDGNTILPYSYAALYGTLLGTLSLALQVAYSRSGRTVQLLAAGALAGLAFYCKMEFGFAAIASMLTLAVTAHPHRRRTIWIAAASILILPLLIHGLFLARIPAESFLRDTYVLPGNLPAELAFYNKSKILGWNDPGRTIRELISACALLCGVAGLISLVSIRLASRSIPSTQLKPAERRLLWITGVSFGLLAVHVICYGTRWDMNPFRALPLFFMALIYYFLKKRKSSDEAGFESRALLLVSVYSLAVLARVIIRVPAGGAYGSMLLPVPFLLFIYMATHHFPVFSMPSLVEQYRLRAVRLLFSSGLLVTLAVLVFRYTHDPLAWLQTPRGSLRVSPPVALAMNQSLEFLAGNSKPGDYVLALPEGSSLNFLADRPSPLRHEIVTPGFLSAEGERQAIRALAEKKVEFVFLFNRPTSEFGPRVFGRNYCQSLMGWIEKNYTLTAVFGRKTSPGIQIGDREFFIKCYRRSYTPDREF